MKENYKAQAVNDHIYAIHAATGEIQYLIMGQNEALLIDTSSGLKGLKELVESLWDQPVRVLLSHGHLDHAGGVSDFDQVYMNEADLPLYQAMDPNMRKDFMEAAAGRSIAPAEIIPFDSDYAFQPLNEGDRFDLGQLHVSVYALPGHTPGSMVFLIEEDGILITGDAANTNTFLFMPEASSVEDYEQALKRLIEMIRPRYHRVFLSHRDVDSGANMLEEGAAVCEQVLAGISDAIPFEFFGSHGLMARKANPDLTLNDGTYFNMVYNPDKIHNGNKETAGF